MTQRARLAVFDKMIIAVLLVLMAMLFLPGFVRAESVAPTISSYGTATISVQPDYAVIVAGYSADNADVLVAQQENAEKMTAIIEAVKALGVDEKDIATSNFSVESIYDYRESVPKLVGYRVNNNITIYVRDILNVPTVLNACFAAGANQSYGLTFKSTKEGEAYQQALSEAVKIAMLKADVMAKASGSALGKVSSIKEIQSGYVTYASYANTRGVMEDAKAMGIGDTIMSGTLDIQAQVEMVFEIAE
ncbi:MAG: SIMPL domain-containing protein [Oscillospiraceae bacterium]|jgi:uncharacterized protein YggE|nr:SIMPL domain-containing protein [Oscillospiraceae bacterium]